MRERQRKGSDGKTTAHDRLANQAEMVVPSTVSVSTEATGIMGAVSGGKSTASDIQHVLSATREAATGSRGEYCVAEDGKVYVSMNALRQYRMNIGGVSKATMAGSLMDNGANGSMAGDDILITAYHDRDHAQWMGIAGNSLDDLRLRQVLLSPRKDQ